MSGGFIKVHRQWLHSEVAREPMVSHLFLHLLLRAAWRPKERPMYGYTLAIGELDDTQEQLAAASGLSRKQVRTCYDKMLNAGMIQVRQIGQGRGRHRNVTTICNYTRYQNGDGDEGQQGATVGAANGTQGGTPKGPGHKKVEKDKKSKNTKPPPPAWAVELADEIRSHVRKQIGKVVQDSQLEKWARALVSLTRSTSLDPKPSPDEVARVVRWGINDHEVRGSWAGWAQQIQSPPNADKFAKIKAAMNKPKPKPSWDEVPQQQGGAKPSW
jgi:hypothetical protein